MYIFISFINAITNKIVRAEVTYKGKILHFMQKTYRNPAPSTAHPVISKTAFIGVLRTLELGEENSANATKSGGATAKRKSESSAGTIIVAAKSVRHKIVLYLIQRGFESGENSFFSRIFPFSKAIRQSRISAVIITADAI